MSLDDLSSDLKKLKDSGSPDLKLDTATLNKITTAITDLRNNMRASHDDIDKMGLTTMGDVGSLGSAMQTKTHLLTTSINVKSSISDLMDYLEGLEATVRKAGTRLIHNG
jgi:hypothetical protein